MTNITSYKQGLQTLTGIAAGAALILCGAVSSHAEEAVVTQLVQNQTAESQVTTETNRPNWKKERFQKFLENHPKLKARIDANGDGKINREELQQARKFRKPRQNHREHKKDYDNNPPGLAGGKGTNWESRPGPQGGPGASPDRHYGRRNQAR